MEAHDPTTLEIALRCLLLLGVRVVSAQDAILQALADLVVLKAGDGVLKERCTIIQKKIQASKR